MADTLEMLSKLGHIQRSLLVWMGGRLGKKTMLAHYLKEKGIIGENDSRENRRTTYYNAMRQLVKSGFIESRKEGRNKYLRLTVKGAAVVFELTEGEGKRRFAEG